MRHSNRCDDYGFLRPHSEYFWREETTFREKLIFPTSNQGKAVKMGRYGFSEGKVRTLAISKMQAPATLK